MTLCINILLKSIAIAPRTEALETPIDVSQGTTRPITLMDLIQTLE